MTISSTTNRLVFAGPGNGFAYNKPVFAQSGSDVYVLIEQADGTLLEPTLGGGGTYDFTISGSYDAASFRYPAGVTVTLNNALPTGWTIAIECRPPNTQTSDYTDGGPLPAERLETDLDRLVVQMQVVQGQATDAVRIAATASGFFNDPIVPVGDRLVGFNAGGTGFTLFTPNADAYLTIPLPVAQGGTGATTILGAQQALDLEPGVDVQPFDADTAIKDTASYFSNAFGLSGVITPAQLTADVNDWNPTGVSGASYIRVDTDASRAITGVAGGVEGRLITIVNVGSNDLVLSHQSTGSSAANRFLFASGEDLTLTPGQSVTLRYDDVTDRWRRLDEAAAETAAGVKLLNAQTASGAASINFTTGIDSTYDAYLFVAHNLVTGTDNVSLHAKLSTDGGSTFLTTHAYFGRSVRQDGTGAAGSGTSGANQIVMMNAATADGLGSGAGNAASFKAMLFNPSSASLYKNFAWEGAHWRTGNFMQDHGSGGVATATAVNAIQFILSSGNITGTIRMYGVAKA